MNTSITAQDVPNLPNILQKDDLPVPLVAVYCGSRMGVKPFYGEVATQLGDALAEHGFGLVYGGSNVGLMGAVADAVLAKNGTAVGVIPDVLMEYEVEHEHLTKLHVADSMHTRKSIMAEYACAFVTLPGGVGTLDEIMEIATWSQLKIHNKPMILVNTNGYYDRLIDHLKFSVGEGFIDDTILEKLVVCNTVAEIIQALK